MNKKTILNYLNYQGKVDEKTNQLIDECILEVQEKAYFKVTQQIFHLTHSPLKIEELDLIIPSSDLTHYFQDCHKCMVIVCTLGIEIDRQMKYYEHIDMAKAVVFDAVSNTYLEECCDEYEKTLDLGMHTFRFAPVYGDLPLALNKPLSRVLQIDKKIGVTLSAGGLFIPMKSMLGMIGLGSQRAKSCHSCIRKESCALRKGGQRCYVID